MSALGFATCFASLELLSKVGDAGFRRPFFEGIGDVFRKMLRWVAVYVVT